MTAKTKTRSHLPTYAERFVAALTDHLPDGCEVRNAQDLIIVRHPDSGAGQLTGWLPDADYRRAVIDQDVTRWQEMAEAKLRREMGHYTAVATTEANRLLSILHPTPKTTRITMHGHAGYTYRVEASDPLHGDVIMTIQSTLSGGALKYEGRVGDLTWTAERLGLSSDVDPDHRGPKTPAQIAEAAALFVVKNHGQEHEVGVERVVSGNVGLDALGWILGGPVEYETGLIEFATAAIEMDRAQRAERIAS